MDSGETDPQHPEIDITEDDPYSDIDLSQLPDWWRRAVEEFREYGLKPYHPPTFEDGTYKHRVVDELEERLGVDVDFVGTGVSVSDAWTVRVDNSSVGTIERHRDSGGYSVYEMESDEFREWILGHVEGPSDGDE